VWRMARCVRSAPAWCWRLEDTSSVKRCVRARTHDVKAGEELPNKNMKLEKTAPKDQ
jgi:hypothetical protein